MSKKEAIHTPKEIPTLTELLMLDLPEAKARIAELKERAMQADRVVITIICCDSRVVLPETLVDVTKKDKANEKVLFIPIPTIGSGAPSRSRLRSIINELVKNWEVDRKNISVLVTQHGDSHEIANQHDEADHSISCGLRKVLLQNSKELTKLGNMLSAWAYRYKIEHEDETLAPDRLTLDVIRNEAPLIMEVVDCIHESSGPSGKRLPRRLIIRAAYRNHHSNLALNESSVYTRIADYLLEIWKEKRKEIKTAGPALGYAAYNHQDKMLLFDNPEADLGWEEVVQLPDIPPRSDSHQDPQYCIVSFGHQSIPLAVREIVPHLCGKGSERFVPPADNAFRTVASLPTTPTLLCALAESMYAVLHHLRPHAGDKNFASLQKVVIICDDDRYEQVVKETLRDSEFIEEYLPMLRELQPEGILVINLHLDSTQAASVKTLAYPKLVTKEM